MGLSAPYLLSSQLVHHVCRGFQEEGRALDHEAHFEVPGPGHLHHRQARTSCALPAEGDAGAGLNPSEPEACGPAPQAEEGGGEERREVERG